MPKKGKKIFIEVINPTHNNLSSEDVKKCQELLDNFDNVGMTIEELRKSQGKGNIPVELKSKPERLK